MQRWGILRGWCPRLNDITVDVDKLANLTLCLLKGEWIVWGHEAVAGAGPGLEVGTVLNGLGCNELIVCAESYNGCGASHGLCLDAMVNEAHLWPMIGWCSGMVGTVAFHGIVNQFLQWMQVTHGIAFQDAGYVVQVWFFALGCQYNISPCSQDICRASC